MRRERLPDGAVRSIPRATVCALLFAAATLAGCGAPDPCDAVSGACLAVYVDRSPMISSIDLLDLDLTFGAHTGHSILGAPNGPVLALPAVTSIALPTLDASPEPITLSAVAHLGARVIGVARTSTTLTTGEHGAVHLALQAVSGDCLGGGLYCGGDKLAGLPDSLYRCVAGGTPSLFMSCPNGCRVEINTDDGCR